VEYDAQKLATLSSQLAEARGRLVELSALTPEEFASDPHKVASAKYHFIVAIEAAVDICNHLIAKNGLRRQEFGRCCGIFGVDTRFPRGGGPAR